MENKFLSMFCYGLSIYLLIVSYLLRLELLTHNPIVAAIILFAIGSVTGEKY